MKQLQIITQQKIHLVLFSVFFITLSSCGQSNSTTLKQITTEDENIALLTKRKAVAAKFLLAIVEGDKDYVASIASENYKQHSPIVADKRVGLLAYMDGIKDIKGKAIHPIRAIAEGDFVLIQSQYDLSKSRALFDLLRFKGDSIVEHFDSLQDVPDSTVNGHSMFDGITVVTDLEKTQENKALVTKFANDVLVNGKMDLIDTYIAENYIQHNPNVKNSREGLKEYLNNLVKNNIQFSYKKIHKIVADGSFVYLYSQGSYSNKEMAFCDLFRVADGMIVEHWDVIQEVPDPSKSANNNGMF